MRNFRNAFVVIPVVAIAAFGSAGCQSDKTEAKPASSAAATSDAAVNTKCCCGKPVDGKSYATYNGQKIGFCAPECVTKFNAMTDAQKQAEVAKLTAAKADHPKADHPSGEHPK